MSIRKTQLRAAAFVLVAVSALAGCAAQAEHEQISRFEQIASEAGFECAESVLTDGIDAHVNCQNTDGESLELVMFRTPSDLRNWTDALVGSDEDLRVELFEDGHTLISGTDHQAVKDVASTLGETTPLEL